MTATDLAARLEQAVSAEVIHLRAVPDGPATAVPNRPNGGGWSQREELGHLIDSAINNHNRFVRAALEPSYTGPAYDPNGWVEAHRYIDLPWPALVDTWYAHNAILVPLIAAIPDSQLDVECTIGPYPPVPLWFLIDDYVLHMRHHIDQILRRDPVTRYPRG